LKEREKTLDFTKFMGHLDSSEVKASKTVCSRKQDLLVIQAYAYPQSLWLSLET
jgi:hypothetical protein